MRDEVFFSNLIDILTESYLEFIISGYISVYQSSKSIFAEKLSIFFGYFTMALSASVLLLIKWQQTENFCMEGGAAEKKIAFDYYVYFFARRTIFMVIIFMYNENLQLHFLLLLNCFSFIYLGHRKPFESRRQNRLEIFNDFMVHLISFHMIFFTGLI